MKLEWHLCGLIITEIKTTTQQTIEAGCPGKWGTQQLQAPESPSPLQGSGHKGNLYCLQ